MDRLLPFGLPGPTAFYLTLYVLTMVVHVVFMNYVLAGAGYLAVTGFRSHRHELDQDCPLTLTHVLRDWLPFATSAAITAGVAPLLFVQILYKQNFYTANLLLFHRWMLILPVLILGFYLLYLLKTRWIMMRPPFVHGVVAVGALGCFAFTGLSWTENHLLSTDRASWPGLYERGTMVYYHAQLLPRLGMWAVGAIPTMCLLAAWQLLRLQRCGRVISPGTTRRMARLAIAGILLCVLCGGAYWRCLDAVALGNVVGSLAGPYLLMAVIGLAVQVFAWIDQERLQTFCARALWVCSAGLGLTVLGMTAVREAIRLSTVDISALYEQHDEATSKGGLVVFVLFMLLNSALIAFCLRLTRSGRTGAAKAGPGEAGHR